MLLRGLRLLEGIYERIHSSESNFIGGMSWRNGMDSEDDMKRRWGKSNLFIYFYLRGSQCHPALIIPRYHLPRSRFNDQYENENHFMPLQLF